MFEDEFAGRGPVIVTVGVLAVPFEGEARVRKAMVASVREGAAPGQRAWRGLLWAGAWVAYLPAIVVYEVFAVSLVAGSLVSAALLVTLVMLVVAPVLLAAKAIGWARGSSAIDPTNLRMRHRLGSPTS